jgi:nitrite reductase/ring-hydroxylating ferredoxin subunit/uncharacterized membrane protein
MPETIGDRLVRGNKGAFLDGLGGFFGAIVGGFYKLPGTRIIKDLLHGTWVLRHPLHPAVTDAVVGGYTAVAALDVISLVQGDATLWKATDIALVVSLLFAIVSVLSGYTDWNDTIDNERRLGILHGTLMSLITIGYAASLWMRLSGGPREPAIYLALGLYVLVVVTSHLGGEMAFGFGTGVNRQAWAHIPGTWQKLAVQASSLEDRKPVRAQLKNGFAVMVAKVDGEIGAIGAVCTHAGGPLDEGEFVGGQRRDIKCPWHGSVFSLRSGAALHGPATMDEPTFETRVAADGSLEVRSRG